MANVWFTADTHFGHANIMLYCGRSTWMDAADFAEWKEHHARGQKGSVPHDLQVKIDQARAEMDTHMTYVWNSTVKPGDTVYHLGDFCMSKRKCATDYLRELNGDAYLIRGNHDSQVDSTSPYWNGPPRDFKEMRFGKTNVVMCHYALRVWNGSYHDKTSQLHGHSHGMLQPLKNQCDVGVDVWDYRPVSLEEIQERITITNKRLET